MRVTFGTPERDRRFFGPRSKLTATDGCFKSFRWTVLPRIAGKQFSSCVVRYLTFALFSMPMVASGESDSASTLIAREHLAASTLEIFPLNFGADCPIREA